MHQVFAVIMAGGVGARFWPASRTRRPKQLLDITDSGETMIAATVARLPADLPPERVLVITSEAIRDAVIAELPRVPPQNIIAEPAGRNTAPCIGLAAMHVRRTHPEAVMAVMPADHLIADVPAFRTAFDTGVRAAAAGRLVTFGIRPTSPETGFGYIELNDESEEGVCDVRRFVEKPSREVAQQYLESGNFVWNSGMFFFTAQAILTEMQARLPALYEGLETIAASLGTPAESAALRQHFPRLPAISIDYGIMEGATGIQCIPVDFGWSDMGSFEAAWELSPKDAQGNARADDHIVVDAEDCLVRVPKDKMVALIGVENLVIVDTEDALLICRKDRSQDVRLAVDALKQRGRNDLC